MLLFLSSVWALRADPMAILMSILSLVCGFPWTFATSKCLQIYCHPFLGWKFLEGWVMKRRDREEGVGSGPPAISLTGWCLKAQTLSLYTDFCVVADLSGSSRPRCGSYSVVFSLIDIMRTTLHYKKNK